MNGGLHFPPCRYTGLIELTSRENNMKKAILGSILLAATVTAHADFRITGGSNVPFDSYEDAFARMEIFFKGDPNHYSVCGSTLINPTTVVTAAHCVDSNIESITLNFKNGVTRVAAGFKRHGGFSMNNVQAGNDIAIVYFNKRVPFKPMVIPTMDEYNFVASRHMVVDVIGFGTSTPYSGDEVNPGKVSHYLKAARVTMATVSECRSAENGMYTASNIMCTLDRNTAGTCQGDSGGPIFYTDSNTGNKVLLGITSFGEGCGQYMVPDYYTNMAWQRKAGVLDNAGASYTLNTTYSDEGDIEQPEAPAPEKGKAKGGSGSMGLGLALLGLIGRRFKK
jgi:secreted trypsin-like serine protease